jgi:hypothetical protein
MQRYVVPVASQIDRHFYTMAEGASAEAKS